MSEQRWERTGEVRAPRAGEWFENPFYDFRPTHASQDGHQGLFWILRPVPAPQQAEGKRWFKCAALHPEAAIYAEVREDGDGVFVYRDGSRADSEALLDYVTYEGYPEITEADALALLSPDPAHLQREIEAKTQANADLCAERAKLLEVIREMRDLFEELVSGNAEKVMHMRSRLAILAEKVSQT
jgi:hypothetical protein